MLVKEAPRFVFPLKTQRVHIRNDKVYTSFTKVSQQHLYQAKCQHFSCMCDLITNNNTDRDNKISITALYF